MTQWTNKTFVGVPGVPTYNGRTPIMNNITFNSFQNYMNSIAPYLPFSYDHAIAVIPST